MVNYGERLVYWYLRLQGFCLVENFVLHRHVADVKPLRTADADLLAIRLRKSREEIDGKRLDPDPWLERELQFATRHVALIVQVKTGEASDAGPAFDRERTVYALNFLGVPARSVSDIANSLADAATTFAGKFWLVGKLLVTGSRIRDADQQPYLTRNMRDVLTFIDQRLDHHADRKRSDRLFFPDELMQFLASRKSLTES